MRLCGISSRFRLLSPCMRQVTHALLTRPPLSHANFNPEGNPIACFVRLACVKHAASVHPEPGSNSQIKMFDLFKIISLANYPCFCFLLFKERLLKVCSLNLLLEFSRLSYCSIIKVLCSLAFQRNSLFSLTYSFELVKHFFILFFVSCRFLLQATFI